MENVILVIHILVGIAMTAVVLMQRSEGGALGIGGGGGGGLVSGRGAAGALVRTTIIFGGIFFLTSLTLTTIAARTSDTRTEVERRLDEEAPGTAPVDILDPDAPLLSDPLTETGDADPLASDPLSAAPVPAPSDPLAGDPLAEGPGEPAETPPADTGNGSAQPQ